MATKNSTGIFFVIMLTLVGCAVSLVNLLPSTSEKKLSPEAYSGVVGFGSNTPAGRYGTIIKVTNLNDSGPGSLRSAAEASGARIVVFEIAGTIALSSDLEIKHPFVTIAGQTAPSPGITISGAGVNVLSHDVLIQHIRIRPGDSFDGPIPDNRDALQIIGNPSYNVVIDHVSASWAIDENISTWYPVHDITISNCIISEALYDSLHSKGPHSMGLLIGDSAENVTIFGNLLASNYARGPRVTGNASVVLVNNVVYNIGDYAFSVLDGSGPVKMSAVGNVFLPGPDTRSDVLTMHLIDKSADGSVVYFSGNSSSSNNKLTYDTSFDPTSSSPPIWHPSLSVHDLSVVEDLVLSNAGARPADRDPVDRRVVNDVKMRSGAIINSQREVGGWPSVPSTYRQFQVPEYPNGDDDGDGLTNIEEVLQLMARRVENYR